MGFLGLFFGSIFDLFLDAALLVRDVFHGVLCDWTPVFGRTFGLLLTVHLLSARFLSLLGMFHVFVCSPSLLVVHNLLMALLGPMSELATCVES